LAPASGPVIRRFGQTSPGGMTSDGMTWNTQAGSQVRAPAGGVVEFSGPLKNWRGEVLILNVGGGYDLVLAGLDRSSIQAGRPVRAGQALGAMGSASELYLELRRQGVPVDPARWFSPESLAANGRG
jgi:septal ring factor EnvC (AmiA/AmiB activator)